MTNDVLQKIKHQEAGTKGRYYDIAKLQQLAEKAGRIIRESEERERNHELRTTKK